MAAQKYGLEKPIMESNKYDAVEFKSQEINLMRELQREPARAPAPARRESALEVLRFMARRRAFVHRASGAALLTFAGYGAGAFNPIFLKRVHHFELAEAGTRLGTIALVAGGLGTYLGGALSDRLARAEVSWYMRVPALAWLLSIVSSGLFYLWPDGRTALLLSIPGSVLGIMYLGPTFAMTQSLVRPEMRALAAAILLFIINAVGLGLGPWFVGSLSDAFEPRFGVDAVRWASLATIVVATTWAAAHYLLGARSLSEDLLAKDA